MLKVGDSLQIVIVTKPGPYVKRGRTHLDAVAGVRAGTDGFSGDGFGDGLVLRTTAGDGFSSITSLPAQVCTVV